MDGEFLQKKITLRNMETDEQKNETEASIPKVKNHNKYRREKPWDTDDIDHWKIDPWTEVDNKTPLVEESSFATLFPKYREKYLREVWPLVTSTLKDHGLACQLDLVEGSMTVKTTRKTYDPFIIVKARDMLKLLSRSVPLQQAKRVLDDEMACDIIKIGGMVRNKERFVKRRQRLVGPDGKTLKAIELLTGCYVLVQGNTVACMGPFKGLKQVRQIVEDCMRNVHPIYNIKTLMVKRELAKDPTLQGESWDRFLPHFHRKNVKKVKKPIKKKQYTPFPPPQQPSKVDLQLESGEYFLHEDEKRRRRLEERKAQQGTATAARKAKREQAFVPTKEDVPMQPAAQPPAVDVGALVKNIKSRKRKATPAEADGSRFVLKKKKGTHST